MWEHAINTNDFPKGLSYYYAVGTDELLVRRRLVIALDALRAINDEEVMSQCSAIQSYVRMMITRELYLAKVS